MPNHILVDFPGLTELLAETETSLVYSRDPNRGESTDVAAVQGDTTGAAAIKLADVIPLFPET